MTANEHRTSSGADPAAEATPRRPSAMRSGGQKYYVMGSDAPAATEVRPGGQAAHARPRNAQPAKRSEQGLPDAPCVDVSVVVPVYGCPGALPHLHERLVATLEGMGVSFEIILVDDACPKGSWAGIQRICAMDSRVQGMRLSRNFGQTQAITAGLEASTGAWVVVMDCDLQDRPESIAQLYDKAQEGYDAVFAHRRDRKDSSSTIFLSHAFYKVYDYFTDGHVDPEVNNFSIARRKVVDSFCSLNEHQRDYATFMKWLGFNQTTVSLEGDERFEGESSYSFRKKLHLASSIITAQSNKPLHFAMNMGFVIAGLAFLYLIFLLVSYLVRPDVQPGWTSVMGSIFLMGGLILAAVGVAGIYIGNIFVEVKNRPLYVVAEHLNANPGEQQ